MSPECQASTFPKGDKENRPAVAVWPSGDIKRDRQARRLRFSLLQEALLRGAHEGFAILIDGLGFARFASALLLGHLGHPGPSEVVAAVVVAVPDVAASARC